MTPAMPTGACAALSRDGRRLHLQHGPIDVMIEAEGGHDQRRQAYSAAVHFFADVLATLAGELCELRAEISASHPGLKGDIARAMWSACAPFASDRITPMASVAGAVADAILSVMCDAADLSKAWVNNGGDIAFHRRAGIGFLWSDPACRGPRRRGAITAHDRPRGIASSGCATFGRGGRSFSLGIADCVTVLADNARAGGGDLGNVRWTCRAIRALHSRPVSAKWIAISADRHHRCGPLDADDRRHGTGLRRAAGGTVSRARAFYGGPVSARYLSFFGGYTPIADGVRQVPINSTPCRSPAVPK